MSDTLLLFVDIVLCFAAGVYARNLGRRGVLWFLISFFIISPFISLPMLFLMGPPRKL
jgi:hypothetical protein